MKHNTRIFAGALIFATVLYIFTSIPIVGFVQPIMAACSGTGCNGQYPNSSGCSTSGTQGIVAQIFPASSQVDLRYSGGCLTSWARTTNQDWGRALYVNATLKNYYTTSSPAAIAVGQSVFTQQRYNSSYPPPFQACGYASLSSIPGPVASPCTP
jgi:hypothetical protein